MSIARAYSPCRASPDGDYGDHFFAVQAVSRETSKSLENMVCYLELGIWSIVLNVIVYRQDIRRFKAGRRASDIAREQCPC